MAYGDCIYFFDESFDFGLYQNENDGLFFFSSLFITLTMSRKTDRLAKKASKKVNTPTVEKVEAAEESSEEEIPVLEQDIEEVEEEEEDLDEQDVEEEEDDEEDDEEVAVEKKSRALRPRINDEVNYFIIYFDMWI